MEQKTQKRKQLSLKEQKKIVSSTSTGGLNGAFGFGGTILKDGSRSGTCAAILRSDGQYHTESLEELEKMGIYPY